MQRLAIATLTLLTAAALASCVPDTAVGPAPGSARASSSALAPASSGATATLEGGALIAAANDAGTAPRTLMPEGPAQWKSIPRQQNGFYAVLDGICSQLGAGRVGKDVVVHYGGGANPMYLDGKRRGAASFIALRDDGLESIGDPVIASPTGIAGASLDDFWVADSTGSRSSDGAILHRYRNGAWKTYEKDQTNLHAWVDGGIIGSLGFAAANGDVWVEGSSTKPPRAMWTDLPYPALSAFPTGDLLLLGQVNRMENQDAPLIARHWAPGKKVTEHPLEKVLPNAKHDYARVYEVAPDEVYAIRADRIARWDGTSFHALAKTNNGAEVSLVRRAGPDELVVLAGTTMQRITATTATTIATPEPVVAMDGVDRGGAWIVGASGKLYRREGEGEEWKWNLMPLPTPAFSAGATMKAKGVVVVAQDDVLLTGMYWEKGPGWKEQELHTTLFRTRPVKETLRCNEPDPENNNINLGHGFQSWPPMATAECKTPFTVLARRSRAIKNDDDWPRLRAALKGHPELGEVALVDFVSGDRTFVGAKSKDLETAKKLMAVVAAKERVRPEIVCGDPEAKRTIAVDLTSGAVVPK